MIIKSRLNFEVYENFKRLENYFTKSRKRNHQMSQELQFPFKKFYEALSDSKDLERKLKPFINQYRNQNMHWVYETIWAFSRILSNDKQQPIIKFNTLLAIKYCFDTCQYVLVTLIQVFLLNKITQIALFRSKIRNQSLMTTYFSTEGYKQSQHNELKKISYNFVMLAIQFIFFSAQVKRFRCVENIQLRQASKYAMSAQFLIEKRIKCPEKFSFFLQTSINQKSAMYKKKLNQFSDEACEIYTQYFLGMIISQIQTGKKCHMDIRNILSFGDAYLTSAMINLCEDELSSILDGFQHKKKYLNLFNSFVRWGDIEAILMVNNSDFITQISVNICTVRGDVNINQGENIYPEIEGRKNEKRQFYIDFLRCIETWAECIPLNEQGIESNVRKIYIFLKEEKKFKFPENLVLKRYKKQLEDNMKKNQERNQKLLDLINEIEQSTINNDKLVSIKKITGQQNKEQPVNFKFLQNKIKNVQKKLQEIIETQQNDKQMVKNYLLPKFTALQEFKNNWTDWLQRIDLQLQQIQDKDQQMLQNLILNGDQVMQAVQIIHPLIEIFKQNKITLQQFLKRVKQNLQIHQDLAQSMSRHLDITKSIGNSAKKDLSQTIQKSILKKSHKNLMSSSKISSSTSKNLVASIYKSKAFMNQSKNPEKIYLESSLKKSLHKSGISSLRHSGIHQKLRKIKQNSSQISKLMESRNVASQKFQQYYKKTERIDLKFQSQHKNEEKNDNLSINQSIQNQKNSKNLINHAQLLSEWQLKLNQLNQSLASSKNYRSEKNITVRSRNSSERLENLERYSKKVVEDMDISDRARKIVVEYSDIDQNSIKKKAHERQKQEILKTQKRKSFQSKSNQIFLENSKTFTKKLQNSHLDNHFEKDFNLKPLRKQTEQLSILNQEKSNVKLKIYENYSQKKLLQVSSHKQKKIKSIQNFQNIIPFDQDYGGKSSTFNNFDKFKKPKTFQNIQKTKKSLSRISNTSEDKNESVRSSKSIRQRIKNRISLNKSKISIQNSVLKEKSERSLQSQMKAIKFEGQSNKSRSLSQKKHGIQVTQINLKGKIDVNEEYSYLPIKNIERNSNFIDLEKTKKISQSKIQSKLKHQNEQQEQKRNHNLKIIKKSRQNESVSSSRGRHFKQGISLSLGKKGSFLVEKIQQIKRNSVLRRQKNQLQIQKKVLRPQYFNENLQKSKCSENDSRIQDRIKYPKNKPMIQSYYLSKDSKQKINEGISFKHYIGNEFKEQIVPQKRKQIQNLIKQDSKRTQIHQIFQNNPQSRKVKSQEKLFYGSFLKQKSTQKQLSYLQSRLKTLEQQSIKMKTKLAVKDQQVKSFKNLSEKIQFSAPSESNYIGSSVGFRKSRLGSEKGNFSPITHQFLGSKSQENEVINYVKQSPYNRYFEKVKGNTFKKTLLKPKCLIEKQDQIEMGCMSIRKQDFSLQVTIFITPLRFDLIDINYGIIHDENLTIDCNPKKIESIELKKQQKISIKMGIKKIPFEMIEFQLTYKSKSEYSTNYFRVPVPILFNKFCQIQPLPQGSLDNKMINSENLIRTSEFRVNTKVIKFQKIKEIFPNFSYSKTKDIHLLTCSGAFKETLFWILIKINMNNQGVIQGILNDGRDIKILQYLMVTFKNIFESQK